jgi:hypothetical protein
MKALLCRVSATYDAFVQSRLSSLMICALISRAFARALKR